MATADGRYTIAYNGEVYNYLDLRAELEGLGRTFATDSDTEVVLEAFAQWGGDGVRPLQRDVRARHLGRAGALADARSRPLRDQAASTYAAVPGRARTAGTRGCSPPRSSRSWRPGCTTSAPTTRTIYRYLRFRIHEDGRETFFDGIERLEAGEMMTISADGGSSAGSTRALREELARARHGAAALRRRRRPPSTSGGSSRRCACACSRRCRWARRCPAGSTRRPWPSSSTGSSTTATRRRSPSGRSRTRSSAVFPGSDQRRGALRRRRPRHLPGPRRRPQDHADADASSRRTCVDFVRTQEEPLISSGPYAQYQVMREATKHVTVLLDGQGADEMMAGYIPYYFVYLKPAAGAGRRQGRGRAVQVARRALPARPVQGSRPSCAGARTCPTTSLLGREFVAAHAGRALRGRGVATSRSGSSRTSSSGRCPSLLRYEDKNTMRFSLEGRVPFLDKEVVKFIFSLSDEAIIKDGWNKRVLRDATRDLLPDVDQPAPQQDRLHDAAGRVVHAPEEPLLRRSSCPSPSRTGPTSTRPRCCTPSRAGSRAPTTSTR